MIQDSDNAVLKRVKYAGVTPEILMRKGFVEELVERSPNWIQTHYRNYELDLDLIEYNANIGFVGYKQYKYAYTTKLKAPVESADPNQTLVTRSISIYTVGQLEAVMRAKRQINTLNAFIENKMKSINRALDADDAKYRP